MVVWFGVARFGSVSSIIGLVFAGFACVEGGSAIAGLVTGGFAFCFLLRPAHWD